VSADGPAIHQHPAVLREAAHPQCDPWAVVTLVMHDLSAHGVKSRYGPETDLGEAAQHAALLLEALGVAAVIPDDAT
jgi:hypothetical protein